MNTESMSKEIMRIEIMTIENTENIGNTESTAVEENIIIKKRNTLAPVTRTKVGQNLQNQQNP
jgi:hypothetical protein